MVGKRFYAIKKRNEQGFFKIYFDFQLVLAKKIFIILFLVDKSCIPETTLNVSIFHLTCLTWLTCFPSLLINLVSIYWILNEISLEHKKRICETIIVSLFHQQQRTFPTIYPVSGRTVENCRKYIIFCFNPKFS